MDYICWKSHFQGVLNLDELTHIIIDVTPPTRPNGEQTDELVRSHKADQLMLKWIGSTVSASIQAMILLCTTAKEMWSLLDRFLSSLYNICIKALGSKLRATKKNSTTPISEYLHKVKANIDVLQAPHHR